MELRTPEERAAARARNASPEERQRIALELKNQRKLNIQHGELFAVKHSDPSSDSYMEDLNKALTRPENPPAKLKKDY